MTYGSDMKDYANELEKIELAILKEKEFWSSIN